MEGTGSVLTMQTLGYGTAFPAPSAPVRTTCGRLLHRQGIRPAMLLTRDPLHSTELQPRARGHTGHCLTTVPPILGSCSDGMVEWPLGDSVQHQLGGESLQGWGGLLEEAVCALTRRPIHGADSPRAGTHGPGIKGWKWLWHHYHPR